MRTRVARWRAGEPAIGCELGAELGGAHAGRSMACRRACDRLRARCRARRCARGSLDGVPESLRSAASSVPCSAVRTRVAPSPAAREPAATTARPRPDRRHTEKRRSGARSLPSSAVRTLGVRWRAAEIDGSLRSGSGARSAPRHLRSACPVVDVGAFGDPQRGGKCTHVTWRPASQHRSRARRTARPCRPSPVCRRSASEPAVVARSLSLRAVRAVAQRRSLRRCPVSLAARSESGRSASRRLAFARSVEQPSSHTSSRGGEPRFVLDNGDRQSSRKV